MYVNHLENLAKMQIPMGGGSLGGKEEKRDAEMLHFWQLPGPCYSESDAVVSGTLLCGENVYHPQHQTLA